MGEATGFSSSLAYTLIRLKKEDFVLKVKQLEAVYGGSLWRSHGIFRPNPPCVFTKRSQVICCTN